MANYPETYNWVDQWKAILQFSSPTEMSQVTNPLEFTIQQSGGTRNAFGVMSMIKRIKADDKSTQWWWGYTTQVNTSEKLTQGQTVQQYLYTLG